LPRSLPAAGAAFRYRLLLVALFVGVFALGVAASWLVRDAAQEVARSSREMAGRALSDIRALDKVREDLLRHERLAYEAYGAIRPRQLAERQQRLAQRLAGQWQRLGELGLSAAQVAYLERHWTAIREHTGALYRNLRAAQTDWDAARAQLGAMQRRRQAMTPLLTDLGATLQTRAADANARNRANLVFMSRLVAVYTGVIFLVAAAVAWVLWRLLRISRRNQALAEFPRRNPNPVLTLDGQGAVRYANPAARDFACQLEGEAAQPAALVGSATRDTILRSPSGALEQEHGARVCLFEWEWLPDLARFHVYVRDITERRRAEEGLRRMAYQDGVTGRPNREGLLEVLEVRLAGGAPGVVTVSLERFDALTTQYGFEAADALLREVGEALDAAAAACLGEDAVVGRLDGGLFGIVASAPGLGASDGEALVARLPREVQAEGSLFQADYWVGVRPSQAGDGPGDGSALLRDANTALLAAERGGGSRVVEHDEALKAAQAERARVEARLPEALRRDGGLQAFVQPKLRLADGAIVGGELLARWQDSELGWVSPGQFIPVAEQSGLIVELGQWALEQAVAMLAHWQIETATAGAHLAVNVAAPELYDDGWADRVLGVLRHYGVAAGRLEVEVTERVVAGPEDWVTVTNLRRLREAGVQVSVDDFGTGYSSLAYVHRLPINRVKIDKRFVDGLPAPDGERSLAGVIVDMADALGLDTVAEGVETRAQAEALKGLGATQVQGFLYARPMPAAEFPAFVTAWNAGSVTAAAEGGTEAR